MVLLLAWVKQHSWQYLNILNTWRRYEGEERVLWITPSHTHTPQTVCIVIGLSPPAIIPEDDPSSRLSSSGVSFMLHDRLEQELTGSLTTIIDIICVVTKLWEASTTSPRLSLSKCHLVRDALWVRCQWGKCNKCNQIHNTPFLSPMKCAASFICSTKASTARFSELM